MENNKPSSVYVPGVCNISRNGIKQRYIFGSVMLAITFFYIRYVHQIAAPLPYRLLTMIPAALGVMGFAQAISHFCSYFGLVGLFDVGVNHPSETPLQAKIRRQDRKKAWQIIDFSLGFGAVITLLTCLW